MDGKIYGIQIEIKFDHESATNQSTELNINNIISDVLHLHQNISNINCNKSLNHSTEMNITGVHVTIIDKIIVCNKNSQQILIVYMQKNARLIVQKIRNVSDTETINILIQ